MAALCDLTAEETARRVRAGERTAGAVLESVVARIEAVEGRSPSAGPFAPQAADRTKVHAYITRTIDRARRQAEAVDGRVARGEDPGLLAGVPLAVKDIYCVRALVTRVKEFFLSKVRPPV